MLPAAESLAWWSEKAGPLNRCHSPVTVVRRSPAGQVLVSLVGFAPVAIGAELTAPERIAILQQIVSLRTC